MTRGVSKPVAALVAVVLAALALIACGSDGDSTTGGGSTTDAASGAKNGGAATQEKGAGSKSQAQSGSKASGGAAQGKQQDEGEGSAKPQGSAGGGSGSSANAGPLRVSGGGSDQFREPGGDNSIQDFGEEADESELEAAAAVLHAYLVARAGEDWAGACSNLAKGLVQQLEQLASQAPKLKDKGCTAVVAALTTPSPGVVQRASTDVDAASLRRDGERAFLLYHGPEADYFMPMEEEDGAWKVGALSPTPFPN